MATAMEIAALLTAGLQGPTGGEDIALHTGFVKSWNKQTGLNVVTVNGVDLTNLKSLQGGIPATYAAGDSVIIMRKQTQYFILGKVAAPGGAAGSAPAGNTVGTLVDQADSAGAWVDLTASPGPTVSTYIGSNRAALILWGFDYAGFQSVCEMGWEVSGANTLAPGALNNVAAKASFTSSVAPQYTMSQTIGASYLMGNTVLTNSGLTTFTAKYKVTRGTPTPVQSRISARTLTVIPL